MKVAQLCLTFCDPMNYTVHGILHSRILEWVAFPFSRGSSWPRNWTGVSCIAGIFFTNWAIREALEVLGLRENWADNTESYHISLPIPGFPITSWCSVQFSSAAQSCLTLCGPMDCSTPGFPVLQQLPEPTQTPPGDLQDPGIEPVSYTSPAMAGGTSQWNNTEMLIKGHSWH